MFSMLNESRGEVETIFSTRRSGRGLSRHQEGRDREGGEGQRGQRETGRSWLDWDCRCFVVGTSLCRQRRGRRFSAHPEFWFGKKVVIHFPLSVTEAHKNWDLVDSCQLFVYGWVDGPSAGQSEGGQGLLQFTHGLFVLGCTFNGRFWMWLICS